MAIKTWFSEWAFLKLQRKSNLWQFLLQYCRLQDSNLSENLFIQRGLHKRFQENILAKDNLNLPEKRTPPRIFKSNTNNISLNSLLRRYLKFKNLFGRLPIILSRGRPRLRVWNICFTRLWFFIHFIVGRKIDRKWAYRKRTRSVWASFKVLVTNLD